MYVKMLLLRAILGVDFLGTREFGIKEFGKFFGKKEGLWVP